jgi:hypothetical protein
MGMRCVLNGKEWQYVFMAECRPNCGFALDKFTGQRCIALLEKIRTANYLHSNNPARVRVGTPYGRESAVTNDTAKCVA